MRMQKMHFFLTLSVSDPQAKHLSVRNQSLHGSNWQQELFQGLSDLLTYLFLIPLRRPLVWILSISFFAYSYFPGLWPSRVKYWLPTFNYDPDTEGFSIPLGTEAHHNLSHHLSEGDIKTALTANLYIWGETTPYYKQIWPHE